MMARLTCFVGLHATYYTDGAIRCRRCATVVESWPVLRPEHAIRAQREAERMRADRERRAARMSTPSRTNVLRMREQTHERIGRV